MFQFVNSSAHKKSDLLGAREGEAGRGGFFDFFGGDDDSQYRLQCSNCLMTFDMYENATNVCPHCGYVIGDQGDGYLDDHDDLEMFGANTTHIRQAKSSSYPFASYRSQASYSADMNLSSQVGLFGPFSQTSSVSLSYPIAKGALDFSPYSIKQDILELPYVRLSERVTVPLYTRAAALMSYSSSPSPLAPQRDWKKLSDTLLLDGFDSYEESKRLEVDLYNRSIVMLLQSDPVLGFLYCYQKILIAQTNDLIERCGYPAVTRHLMHYIWQNYLNTIDFERAYNLFSRGGSLGNLRQVKAVFPLPRHTLAFLYLACLKSGKPTLLSDLISWCYTGRVLYRNAVIAMDYFPLWAMCARACGLFFWRSASFCSTKMSESDSSAQESSDNSDTNDSDDEMREEEDEEQYALRKRAKRRKKAEKEAEEAQRRLEDQFVASMQGEPYYTSRSRKKKARRSKSNTRKRRLRSTNYLYLFYMQVLPSSTELWVLVCDLAERLGYDVEKPQLLDAEVFLSHLVSQSLCLPKTLPLHKSIVTFGEYLWSSVRYRDLISFYFDDALPPEVEAAAVLLLLLKTCLGLDDNRSEDHPISEDWLEIALRMLNRFNRKRDECGDVRAAFDFAHGIDKLQHRNDMSLQDLERLNAEMSALVVSFLKTTPVSGDLIETMLGSGEKVMEDKYHVRYEPENEEKPICSSKVSDLLIKTPRPAALASSENSFEKNAKKIFARSYVVYPFTHEHNALSTQMSFLVESLAYSLRIRPRTIMSVFVRQ